VKTDMIFKQVVIWILIALYFWAATIELRLEKLEKHVAVLERSKAADKL